MNKKATSDLVSKTAQIAAKPEPFAKYMIIYKELTSCKCLKYLEDELNQTVENYVLKSTFALEHSFELEKRWMIVCLMERK